MDNDGNALVAGALYFSSTDGAMKVYTGSTWVAAYVSGAGTLVAANNLSDLVSVSAARTNLGLGTAATTASTDYATAAQGTKADTAHGWGNHASAGYLTTSSAASTYQPLDGDLTAIGGLSGTSGFLKKTAANTWSLDTNTYLTSYTETDPVYTASSWYSTTNNSSNWNTAFGWGNHASAGYAADSAVVKLTGDQTIAGTKTFSSTITGSISGNAGTVTNGVYTTGSYANPAWITSLDGSKLTGTVVATNGVVTTGSYANPSWITSLSETKVLPSQTSNSGKFLTTNGTSTSWATVDALPSQTGNSGKYLTTNGTTASWATVSSGNVSSFGIWENANTISSNYTISTNNNAMSAGPITVANGVTVTVPSGSVWVVI